MALMTRNARDTISEILEGPALKPPPGIEVVEITNTDPAQKYYYPMAVLCTVVPGVLLLLRLYTRLRVYRKFDLTDRKSIMVCSLARQTHNRT